MATARRYSTVTLLPNGKVLIAWGLDGTTGYLASGELLRPASYEPYLIVQSIITNPTPSNRDIQSLKMGQSLQDGSKLKKYIKEQSFYAPIAKEVR